MMRADLALSLVVGVLLLLLVVWSRRLCCGGTAEPDTPKRPRATRDPTPFAGRTHKPECPACRGDRAQGQHTRQTRSRLTPAVGAVPDLSQFRVASRQFVRATARCAPGDGVREEVAAADARH